MAEDRSPQSLDVASLEALKEAVAAGLPTAISDLGGLVRIPSVSWDGFDPANVDASAAAARDLLEATGVFDKVIVSRARARGDLDGQAAVLGTRAAKNGAPTLMLYAHHDVQPPGDPDLWESAPFEPTVRGDRLYGRGAADDKAGVMAHVAAIRAFTEVVGPDFDLGLVAFFEGEEEFGSRSFKNFLEQHRAELAADVIVVADSDNWDVDTPALTVGLRGNVTFRLKISTLDHASHSGMFGGAAPDAMLAAVRLLATLHAADGSVAVHGLTSREATVPDYSEDKLREEAALLPGVTPIGHGPVLSRLWDQPAITITGIDAPTVLNASNTLVRRRPRVQRGRSGRRLPRRHFRLGGRRGEGRDGRRLGQAADRDGRGRLDPVHRRPRHRVPRCADPRHRGRGSGLASAQPERVAAPRCLQARDPDRGRAAGPPRLPQGVESSP
jgi:acetylornithine deacetylase/succinyl-diaminopimelate desuccinylase-like protein